MKGNSRSACLLIVFILCLATVSEGDKARVVREVGAILEYSQETLPAPPADRALIYFAGEKSALVPLPFEKGATPLHTQAVARYGKTSYVEIKGAHAASVIANDSPRFYLFVPDTANAHPPFLVRLTPKHSARRVTVLAQRGLSGFAIASEEIVMPRYRVISREGGMIYMEVSPRQALAPGEYALLGTDLERIATFRIAELSNSTRIQSLIN